MGGGEGEPRLSENRPHRTFPRVDLLRFSQNRDAGERHGGVFIIAASCYSFPSHKNTNRGSSVENTLSKYPKKKTTTEKDKVKKITRHTLLSEIRASGGLELWWSFALNGESTSALNHPGVAFKGTRWFTGGVFFFRVQHLFKELVSSSVEIPR